MSRQPFRWGILSTAKIGREQVMPAIARSEDGVIHAIASRDADRAGALAARFGAPHSYGDYDALLADPEVDGVYLPIPTAHHAEWSIRAAAAGKHVLCEKPIALQAGQIDEIIAARDTHGVVISEAFMVWYHPQWHKVRALIAEGAIGRLRHVSGAFSYHLTDPANMRNKSELGGGALPDIGVYPVVTTLIATGAEPRGATAQVEYSPEFGTDIFARADVAFDGFALSMHVSSQMALHQSMRFFGETGWIDVPAPFNPLGYGDAQVILHDQKNTQTQVFRFGEVNQYALQSDAFVRASRGESDEVFPLEFSRRVQQVIDEIYRAGGPRPQ
ncbi:Predicted dehydrogenase [Cribrihabitans marinus]|uniref:Predicted dehydrogenase n=1 Tax=Cribrihabitans marinus TaxID=1227549 RepID=A0A1H6SNI7_9RHOB|nr:Gfo/Idh/MocA family oxidoreductase [Cribrihabitans marinus]GGH23079.1 oxidoreductase [Cribrihabitans marinus]SEI69509.1 Predicted dehydrogenase [Cribrihabitans marinus]